MIVALEPRTEELQSSIRQLAKESADALALQRLWCVLLVHAGNSPARVASWSGVSERSIRRFVRRYDRQGLQSIKGMVPAGRPVRLGKNQLASIYQQLGQPPSHFGYQAKRWTGNLLQRHIQQHLAVNLSLRQCQRLLKKFRTQLENDEVISSHQD